MFELTTRLIHSFSPSLNRHRVLKSEIMVEKNNPGNPSREPTPRQAGRAADGFDLGGEGENSPLDLGASDDAPPAYGELYDQLNLSQAGFNASAVVTGEETRPVALHLLITKSPVLKPLHR